MKISLTKLLTVRKYDALYYPHEMQSYSKWRVVISI